MNRINTKQIAYELYKASDEEFAEIFAYLNKMRNNELLNDDEDRALGNMQLDPEYMQIDFSKDITNLCGWIEDSLGEIVDSSEVDVSAWWKVAVTKFEVTGIRLMTEEEWERATKACPDLLASSTAWWLYNSPKSNVLSAVQQDGQLTQTSLSNRRFGLRPVVIAETTRDDLVIGQSTLSLGRHRWTYIGNDTYLCNEILFPTEYESNLQSGLNTWLANALGTCDDE